MDKKNDNYDEYADAKRSGLVKKKPTESIVTPLQEKIKKPFMLSEWLYRAAIITSVFYLGKSGLEYFNKPPVQKPIKIAKPSPPKQKTKIVYRDRIVFKDKIVYKDKIVFKDKPVYRDKIVYRDRPDYKCQQDIALQRLKFIKERDVYWIDKFYNTPRAKGELQRTLTF